MPAYEQAVGILRPGGVLKRVGVPPYDDASVGFASLLRAQLRHVDGPAPARVYVAELLPENLEGTVYPGKVFDTATDPTGMLDGYRAVDKRRSLKVLVTSWRGLGASSAAVGRTGHFSCLKHGGPRIGLRAQSWRRVV